MKIIRILAFVLLSVLLSSCFASSSDVDSQTFADYQAELAFDDYKQEQYDSFSETAMEELREFDEPCISGYDSDGLPIPCSSGGSSNDCSNGCQSPPPGCDIKGNISYNTGEKIFHVPGQTFYSETRIDYSSGERWFCTESDAIRNGWRKAYN